MKHGALGALMLLLAVQHAAAAVVGYDDRGAWAGAAGPTTLIDFEAFADGTIITNQLSGSGISSVAGNAAPARGGGPVDVYVTDSSSLPFPMFTAGMLPSEPNFLSIDLSRPHYATGSITFTFSAPQTAAGGFVADSAPVGDFTIEVFDEAISLGSISVAPRTLPDSFVGIVSDQAFTSAVFRANDIDGDSWGLDNVELSSTVIPEPSTLAIWAGLGGIGLVVGWRRRRK